MSAPSNCFPQMNTCNIPNKINSKGKLEAGLKPGAMGIPAMKKPSKS